MKPRAKTKARKTYKPFIGQPPLEPGEIRVTLVQNPLHSFPDICAEMEMPEDETPLEKLLRYQRKHKGE